MNANKLELISKWFKKAKNDLRVVQQIMTDSDYPTDIVCFHSQQAIEKFLKAILIYRDIEFKRSHDLIYLLNFSELSADTKQMYIATFLDINYYAVNARYPGEEDDPTIAEAELAFQIAKDVFDLAERIIYEKIL